MTRGRRAAKKTLEEKSNDDSSNSISVPTKNSFSPLNNNVNVDEQDRYNTNNTNSNIKIKVPPVFVSKDSIKFSDLQNVIVAITKEFKIKDIKDFFKVDIETINSFRTVIKSLDNREVQYHTYRLPIDKTLDVVLKHIPTSIEDQEIVDELELLGYKVFKIMRIRNKDKSPIPVVSIYLYKNHDKNKDIFDLTRLFNCVVAVEPKRKIYDIPQCYNCQRYGHTKNYCKLKIRCMKCAGNHPSKDCNQSNEVVKCINCGESHQSNFKGCEHYTNLRKMRFSNNNINQKISQVAAPQPPPPLYDLDTFPDRLSAVSNSTFASIEHSYAKKVSENKNENEIPKDSGKSNNFLPNNIIDSIFEAIKPIIASVIEKLKPMIQDIILQLFNGSK
ncbi:hypothetical protein M8J75_011374 [Diaphorina citri]|nr:hypothetical protein M8J75_011374 [Diaphorina citri]